MKMGGEIKKLGIDTDSKHFSSEALLHKLKQEKERLLKNKSSLKTIENSCMREEETPFRIPEHWKWVLLDQVSIIQEGPGIRKFQYQKNGIQFLTVTNILDDAVDLEKSKKYVSLNEYNSKYTHFKINKGDIVTACSGGSWGKSAIFNYDDTVILNTSTLRLRFFGDLGDNKYLYYLTKADFFKDQIQIQLSGQQPNFGYSHYSILKIPLPPLPEQHRIVTILDEAFAAIAKAKKNAEKNLANAREVFEGYLQSVFENRGEGWEEKSLGEVCLLITKGSSPKWQGIKYVEEPGILFVTSENVGEYQLILENRKYVEEKFNTKDKKSILKTGDVLTNIVGASIGRTAIYTLDDIANINQAVCLLRCNPKLIFNEYLMNLLNSPFLKEILHSNEVNNARANLSLGFFSNLSIPLPSLPDQHLIVKKLNTISAEIRMITDIYQQKLTDLDELKKSILEKAFAGELNTN